MDYNIYPKASSLKIIVQSEDEKYLTEHLLTQDNIKGFRVIVAQETSLYVQIKTEIKSSEKDTICIILNDNSSKTNLTNFLQREFNYDVMNKVIKQRHVEIFVWRNKDGAVGFYNMLNDGIVDNQLSQSARYAIKYNRNQKIAPYVPELDNCITTKTYLLWQRDPMNSLETAIKDGNIDVSNIFTQERSELKLLSSK